MLLLSSFFIYFLNGIEVQVKLVDFFVLCVSFMGRLKFCVQSLQSVKINLTFLMSTLSIHFEAMKKLTKAHMSRR